MKNPLTICMACMLLHATLAHGATPATPEDDLFIQPEKFFLIER